MPIYTYKNKDTGEIKDREAHYDDRDSAMGEGWERIPSPFVIPGERLTGGQKQQYGVFKQLYDMENAMGADFKGAGEFSKNDLKRIWEAPPPPTQEEHDRNAALAAEKAQDAKAGKRLIVA